MASTPPRDGLESTIELLVRAREGDAAALDRLYARYLPRLRRWASGRLPVFARDLHETDDLVQDVLLRSIRHVEGFEIRGSGRGGGFHGYLRQALTNRIRDAVRAVQRRPEVGDLQGDEADGRPSPLDEAIGRAEIVRYENALARLKPEDREAIVARIEMDLSYEELADALGKPSWNAARMAVVRALERLAREMNANDGAAAPDGRSDRGKNDDA
jgi:RNA polymerase sigma-70 factor (ECF subfamily)